MMSAWNVMIRGEGERGMTRNPDNMYNKILEHSECVIEIGAFYYSSKEVDDVSAIQIANYGNGDNLAIECIKCNEVIIDIDKPIEER